MWGHKSTDTGGASMLDTAMAPADGSEPLYSRREAWYSPNQALMMVAALFVLASLFGSQVPPFQSPDEFNHVKRAYLLSHGHIVTLNRGSLTGGDIDEGLLQYMDCFMPFPLNYHTKVERASLRACDAIHFSGRQRFSSLPNTAMYFPLPYAAQAFAFAIGERSGMSVARSYYLARLLSLSATLLLLLAAFTVYSVPPGAVSLFFMPMCLFQLSAASLDSVTFAMTVVAASLFLRAYRRELPFGTHHSLALSALLLLLATSRVIYIVLAPLLMVLYRVRRSPRNLVLFVVVFLLAASWIGFSLLTVHGQGANAQETSSSDIVKYYLVHPEKLLGVLIRTFGDGDLMRGWWEMFVGNLGWLDIPLGTPAYVLFAVELAGIVVVSFPTKSIAELNFGNAALALVAAGAFFMLLLVSLSAWTPHPATILYWIEGRYFYPIAILFMFSIWSGSLPKERSVPAFAILTLIAVSSLEIVIPKLVSRYYG